MDAEKILDIPEQEIETPVDISETETLSELEEMQVEVYKLFRDGMTYKDITASTGIGKNLIKEYAQAGAEILGEEFTDRRRGKSAVAPANVLPRKSANEKSAPSPVVSKDGLAKQVFGLHQVAALMTGKPEFQISEGESKIMGDALFEIVKDSNLEFLTKYGKYIDLAVAVAIVEIPMTLRVVESYKVEKEEKEKEIPDIVDKKEKVVALHNSGVAVGEPLK